MPARIHPFSLALGLVLAVICSLAMRQSTVQMPLRVEYVPHPRDFVLIKEGTPYTVPTGKLFVLTGSGRAMAVRLPCSKWMDCLNFPPCRTRASSVGRR